MIYRVFIVCLFLILCIFLIYFALKNKQIETFQDTSKRIIVKNDPQNYPDLHVFSYDEIENIKWKDTPTASSANKVLAIFCDLTTSVSPGPGIIYKFNDDDVIQIINVYMSGGSYKKITLKDTGKVEDESTEIDGLSDIIQIAPNSQDNFIALTSYNTLKRYMFGSGSDPNPSNIFESSDSNDPIVSIQGFTQSDIIVFLTMTGKLKCFNSTSQTIVVNEVNEDLKVIQFNIPTYSNYSGGETTNFPISYIGITDNNQKKIVFNDTSKNIDMILSGDSLPLYSIVTYDDDITQSIKCYVVTNQKKLFSYVTDEVGFLIYGEQVNKYIDENILAIIASNDELYYLKSGTINCDLLDTTTPDGLKIYFPYNNNCVTCGINTEFIDGVTLTNSKPDNITDSTICKCSDGNTHSTQTDTTDPDYTFDATAREEGCRNYASCPGNVPLSCNPGLYSSNVTYYAESSSSPNISELTPSGSPDYVLSGGQDFIVCPKCVKCSVTAQEAVNRGGTIVYGTSHPSSGSPLSDDDDCVSGSDTCQYYIKDKCTSSQDTKFAKRTMWSDLNDNDNNKYSETISQGPSARQYKFAENTSTSTTINSVINSLTEGTANDPNPSSSSSDPFANVGIGKDDEFSQCIDVDCCSLGNDKYSFAKIGTTDVDYDCTNGEKRICDTCNKIYSCPISSPLANEVFITPFTSDTKNLNHFLEECGVMGVHIDKEAFNKHATLPFNCESKLERCPATGIYVPSSSDAGVGAGATSECPDLFSSTPCPIADDFTSCPDLFSSS